MLGQLLLVEGDRDGASRYLEEALTASEGTGDRQAIALAETLLAELAIMDSRPQDAVARLTALTATDDAHLNFILPVLVGAHLEAGNEDEALRLAQEAVTRATERDERLALADALRAMATVAVRTGRHDEARDLLDRGLELARSLPYPYAEGRLLWEEGLMLAKQAEPVPARERFQQALAIFRRLGAARDVERVERELAELTPV
jgi:tetratricopeptide (TPR) repeat protein